MSTSEESCSESEATEVSACEEDVLCEREKWLLDRVRPGKDKRFRAKDVDQGHGAYQDWLHIRENNVVLSVIFKLVGHGLAQPTLCERLMLFALYAGVLFLCTAVVTATSGHVCRDSWVNMCVHVDSGGQCDAARGIAPPGTLGSETCGCASNATLAATPAPYQDFRSVAARTDNLVDLPYLLEYQGGIPAAQACPCSLPMCGTVACALERCVSAFESPGNDTVGVCPCSEQGAVVSKIGSLVLTTIWMKVIYAPLRCYYMREVRAKCVWIPCHIFVACVICILFIAGYGVARIGEQTHHAALGLCSLGLQAWDLRLVVAMAGEVVLAASLDDQGIFATDLHSGALVATFEESSAQPGAIGLIGKSSAYVYAVQAKKALWSVWAWGDRKPCYRASLPEKTTAMTFTTDGSFCFAGAASGSLYVWQMGTGVLLRCWPAHFREVTQLVLSQDESFLVSASADATVQVYSMADIFAEHTPRPFHSWSGHALAVTSLALPPGAGGLRQTVVSASLDRSVRIWDIGTGKQVAAHTLPSPIHSIDASPSGSEFICACGDGELRSLAPSCSQRASGSSSSSSSSGSGLYTGHTGAVVSCAFNADGSRVASCSEADRVRIWETRTRQCVSQVHASRNVQIGSVRIVHRSAISPGLPAFQPFQRLLTAPEDAPPVPLCLGGRAAALQDKLEAHARSDDFIDRVVWSEASGLQAVTHAQAEGDRLAEAQAERARWAAVAAQLYDELTASEGVGVSGVSFGIFGGGSKAEPLAVNDAADPGQGDAVESAAAEAPKITGPQKKKRKRKA